MRNRMVSAWIACLLFVACGGSSGLGLDVGPDASPDAATCSGTPPVICDGCCGGKYAADQCLNGAWSCLPRAVACPICDAGDTGSDADGPDTASDAGACTGTPPVICNGCCGSKYAADACLNGVWTCRPLGVACVICDAGTEGDAASDPCGARDDAGVAHTGACPSGQFCCDQSHTGATSFVCRDVGVACPGLP